MPFPPAPLASPAHFTMISLFRVAPPIPLPRANASKLYLLTTEVKNQRKISISRLIYFHRFKAIAEIIVNKH
ncbi:RNA:NAD 2'-phosphotransferase (plasmid) [Nostoc flagelliforme CCNUN1]|uniref:RNA:NAD 2'-phosphotransferase n=1 Tax=Nostoc flagelliforme CCNUN1 TaxID=2038116 RepID=A0A2K8T701_9NOSO|nr:RNA:NAD 2'-phosphotransferase [Nostoc flagelliforme CCNUN1]